MALTMKTPTQQEARNRLIKATEGDLDSEIAAFSIIAKANEIGQLLEQLAPEARETARELLRAL